MSARFHPYLCGRNAAEWLIDMKPTYLDAGKLAWYPDIACPVCGGDVNSWDKRCSRALGYRQIVCEGCISEEYQVTVENLRYVMENHFGLVPCPGI